MAVEDPISVKIAKSQNIAELISEDQTISTADNNKKHRKSVLFSELSDYAAAVQSSSEGSSSTPSYSSASNDLFGAENNGGVLGVNDDDDDDDDSDNPDPYANGGLLKKLKDEIAKLATELKSGSLQDHMAELGQILNDLTSLNGNVVGQDAESQTAMSGYIGGAANVQKYLADQTGTADQDDINPYTGKPNIDPKTGKPIQVTATVALQHELSYLSNNSKTEYELNSDGTPVVDHTDPDGTKHYRKSRIYEFFNDPSNKGLSDSLQGNINTLVNSLTDGTYKPSMSGTAGYVIDPATGKLVPGSGSEINIPDGAIKNAWDQANNKQDPSIVTRMQTAAAALSSTLTSGSAALQAVAKSDTQQFQSAQGATNNFLMDWITLEKSMVKGQVSG